MRGYGKGGRGEGEMSGYRGTYQGRIEEGFQCCGSSFHILLPHFGRLANTAVQITVQNCGLLRGFARHSSGAETVGAIMPTYRAVFG